MLLQKKKKRISIYTANNLENYDKAQKEKSKPPTTRISPLLTYKFQIINLIYILRRKTS